MKTNHGLLFGFAVISIAAIFTFAGCDDGSGDTNQSGGDDYTGPSGTIRVEQTNPNEFTLTLSEGLTWVDEVNDSYLTTYMIFWLKLGEVTASGTDDDDKKIESLVNNILYNFVRTNDTVVTVTMSQYVNNNNIAYFGNGKLILKDLGLNASGQPPQNEYDFTVGASIMWECTNEGSAYTTDSAVFNGKLKWDTSEDALSEVEFAFEKHN